MRVCFVTFLYRGTGKYTAKHVNALAAQLHPHRLVCITDMPEGVKCETRPLTPVRVEVEKSQPNNFAKLQAFDAAFQGSLDADWIIGIDLDVIIRSLPPVIMTPRDGLIIMEGTERKTRMGGRVCRYNSSLWACKPGECASLWDEFTPERAVAMLSAPTPHGHVREVGSDQRWIAERWPGAKTVGRNDGIVQYVRGVPENAAMIFFAGTIKPWGSPFAAEWKERSHVSAHARATPV